MPRQNSNTYLLVTLIACIAVTICAMILAVFIAGQRPVVIVVNAPAAPAAAPAPVVTGVPTVGQPAKPPVGPPTVTAAKVAALPPLGNPLDPAWDRAASLELPLQPQAVAPPMLETATISSVRVQAMHDGSRVAWRLSWAASAPARTVDTSQACDAVAIQFGFTPDTPFTMGGPGKPVRVLHWKALWQRDVDEGPLDVTTLHPNAWSDPYTVDPQVAQMRMIGQQAGNPMANPQRKQPVEEIVAEGFGSVTTVSDAPSTGRGVWKDGRWTVVFERPVGGEDLLGQNLRPGKSVNVSLAVWDGSAGNVGARKHWCNWVPMRLEP